MYTGATHALLPLDLRPTLQPVVEPRPTSCAGALVSVLAWPSDKVHRAARITPHFGASRSLHLGFRFIGLLVRVSIKSTQYWGEHFGLGPCYGSRILISRGVDDVYKSHTFWAGSIALGFEVAQ